MLTFNAFQKCYPYPFKCTENSFDMNSIYLFIQFFTNFFSVQGREKAELLLVDTERGMLYLDNYNNECNTRHTKPYSKWCHVVYSSKKKGDEWIDMVFSVFSGMRFLTFLKAFSCFEELFSLVCCLCSHSKMTFLVINLQCKNCNWPGTQL